MVWWLTTHDGSASGDSSTALSTDPVFNNLCYFQVGNPTATVIALCALHDVSIEQESSQLAILELGGIGILLNILKTDNWPCVVSFFFLIFSI